MRLALFILFSVLTTASAATYYVRTDGNNSNNGLANTSGGAWLTIAHANATLAAGDIVRVQAGTYNEQPTLTKSGTSGSWINYVADGSVVCRGFVLTAVSFCRLTGFEITHTSLSFQYGVKFNTACSNCEVIDCYIHNTQGSATRTDDSGNNHLVVRGCEVYWTDFISGVYTNFSANGIIGDQNGGYNLFEYNRVHRTCDVMIGNYGTNNINRNNEVYDFTNSYWNGDDSVHSDTFQDGSDGAQAFDRNHVYERNFCHDQTAANSHFGLFQDQVTPHGDTNNLLRGNIVFNFGSGGIGDRGASDKMATYNNVFYTVNGAWIAYQGGGNPRLPINCLCANTAIYTDPIGGPPGAINNGSTGGITTHNSGFNTYTGAGSSYITTSDPKFVSLANTNFHLQSSSPVRGLGTNLVWITSSSSSGTIFTVNDSQLLIDGWGIVQGDTITTGGTTTTIVSNNWGNNTLTVANSVTWTNLQPVYWGTDTAPDIGALPFGSQDLTNATMVKSGTTYTVTPGGDAREVWFYVDGIPTTNATAAPFQATIPSGTVTAKAYALYAQANPVVTANLVSSTTASLNLNSATIQMSGATMQISQ